MTLPCPDAGGHLAKVCFCFWDRNLIKPQPWQRGPCPGTSLHWVNGRGCPSINCSGWSCRLLWGHWLYFPDGSAPAPDFSSTRVGASHPAWVHPTHFPQGSAGPDLAGPDSAAPCRFLCCWE